MNRWTFILAGSPGARFVLSSAGPDSTASLRVDFAERIPLGRCHEECGLYLGVSDNDPCAACADLTKDVERACELSLSPADRVSLACALLEGTDHKAVRR